MDCSMAFLGLSTFMTCRVEAKASSFFLKVNFRKMNSGKINYFLMFGSVMKNKLENNFQHLVMSWKMS